MATSPKKWKDQVLVDQGDRETVLAVISARPSVTIEELLHSLPWICWGYLFFILGECLQEGSVILCQREFQFETWVSNTLHKDPRGNGSGEIFATKFGKPVACLLTRS